MVGESIFATTTQWQDRFDLVQDSLLGGTNLSDPQHTAGGLGNLFGLRAGAVCVVSDRTPWPGPAELDMDNNMARAIEVATRAMLRVAG